eukprot:TRINITY_DN3622_c0_g1_i1.p1 TRINITY_DN3622_c0_g1~~TRINITY_DN3622_c0_g1_i1.p1  ORF type:complete len:335 (-),score=76.64 TRINITY_DN3622_c0_g1_i1:557-1474(-)
MSKALLRSTARRKKLEEYKRKKAQQKIEAQQKLLRGQSRQSRPSRSTAPKARKKTNLQHLRTATKQQNKNQNKRQSHRKKKRSKPMQEHATTTAINTVRVDTEWTDNWLWRSAYLQCLFINLKTKAAFEIQQKKAQKKLYVAVCNLEKEKEAIHQSCLAQQRYQLQRERLNLFQNLNRSFAQHDLLALCDSYHHLQDTLQSHAANKCSSLPLQNVPLLQLPLFEDRLERGLFEIKSTLELSLQKKRGDEVSIADYKSLYSKIMDLLENRQRAHVQIRSIADLYNCKKKLLRDQNSVKMDAVLDGL